MNDSLSAKQESPLPVDPTMFPSWPAKSELVKGPKRKNYEHSPRAPEGGAAFSKLVSQLNTYKFVGYWTVEIRVIITLLTKSMKANTDLNRQIL